MTTLPVACSGDVTAAAGALPFAGATVGKWTAGTVEETAATSLKVDDSFVLHTATCTFSFTGSSPPSPTPVTGTATVTLSATAPGLVANGQLVLRAGDSATDPYGNTLLADSSRRLHSS
ncbi:hypothetical protein [Streptomyces sp. RKAG293]|uniref:hypothetical protein n=1 Tax=Streptomyces sp. RKAG293 TaxID=2893403 RepID=UPI0020348643|nr:hypothetical protein [Streptomyces sp. RKAG293]MCM2422893.1 hypothetical protein [Streptomyces sp. RKAG293]